jgi:hypothetical protein
MLPASGIHILYQSTGNVITNGCSYLVFSTSSNLVDIIAKFLKLIIIGPQIKTFGATLYLKKPIFKNELQYF